MSLFTSLYEADLKMRARKGTIPLEVKDPDTGRPHPTAQLQLGAGKPNNVDSRELDPRDGWFRFPPGSGKRSGYGIMIRKIKKQTVENFDWMPNYMCYKVSIWFLPNKYDRYEDDTPKNWERSPAWLIVDPQFTYADVEAYINNNKSKWVP